MRLYIGVHILERSKQNKKDAPFGTIQTTEIRNWIINFLVGPTKT